MALRRRTNSFDPLVARQDELAAALLAEWRNPSEDPDAEPLIIIDRDDPRDPIKQLRVVWSAWDGLSLPQRTQTIRRAYEQFLGDDLADLEQLEQAEGLLPGEASLLGATPD